MFVSALIVLLLGFLPKRFFQTGTAQRGEATVPAATDRGEAGLGERNQAS